MKIERYHWFHYFGGFALILLILQLVTGIFLTLFYQPHLLEAYGAVQSLYKDFSVGAWFRDAHRWIAFFIGSAIVMHIIRSLLRKEFMNYEKKTIWLTGSLLLVPVMMLFITGFILPWEWKGYWFMEMVPNHLGTIPFVGEQVKKFLIDAFTMNRNFVAHVVIFPVITIILFDFHIFAKLRRRKGGIPKYLLKHSLITIPFFIIIAVLAMYIPMPTEDPEIIPMPLEGINIPEPEWFYLIFLLPCMYFEETIAAILVLYVPLVLFLLLTVLPFFFKNHQFKSEKHEPGGDFVFKESRHLFGHIFKRAFLRKGVSFIVAILIAGAMFGLVFTGVHQSPTLGCNSCHNISMGTGIGVPPKAFKDRIKEPKNDNSQWMVEHWFYPTVTW